MILEQRFCPEKREFVKTGACVPNERCGSCTCKVCARTGASAASSTSSEQRDEVKRPGKECQSTSQTL